MFLCSMNNTDSLTHIGKVTEMKVTTELEQETDLASKWEIPPLQPF